MPDGSAVWARLYVGVWGGTQDKTGWVNTTLNGASLGTVTLGGTGDTNPTYSGGTNAYSSGNGVWWVSYNATDSVAMNAQNIATATTGGTIDGRVYGIVLALVYQNTSLPKVGYWINEGNVNLHYNSSAYPYVLDSNFTWFNGTAYSSTEARLNAVYLTGSSGEPDYLYFDFESFISTNDSTAFKDIVNTAANNYAIFWRGHDDNSDGWISAGFQVSGLEGEAYVHPVLAVLKLKNITLYDFSLLTSGTDGWAYRWQNNSRPPSTCDVPNTEFTTAQYNNITADDGKFQNDSSDSQYAAHRFNISIKEVTSNISKINVMWNGIGTHDNADAAQGATLYIWNGTGYEQLDSTTSGTEVYLTGERTSSISNYINAGNATVLVEQNTAGSDLDYSHIKTDYVRVIITTT